MLYRLEFYHLNGREIQILEGIILISIEVISKCNGSSCRTTKTTT